MAQPSVVNDFLRENGITIKDNPAISPDAVLDFDAFMQKVEHNHDALARFASTESSTEPPALDGMTLWPRSRMQCGDATAFLLESEDNGDCCLLVLGTSSLPFEDTRVIAIGCNIVPLYWDNIIHWKNFVQQHDPETTVFPKAAGMLSHTSIGVGARFTTLHWPAVAWTMSQCNLPLTANQNSVPRELVYDVGAMVNGTLSDMPFPFIGGSVPEGHQGQSVQGMSQASVITYVKNGFHHTRIPYGFNADHQPIGGRFDEIEDTLVQGSLFASYITYDLSPELSRYDMAPDTQTLEKQFEERVDTALYDKILQEIEKVGVSIDRTELKRLVTYLAPAMHKMKRRDDKYHAIRNERFVTEQGRRFFKELSIDELPGETTPDTIAVSLAFAQALGVRFNFVAPNIGFQKNFPYEDNQGLRVQVEKLYQVASQFGVSLGIHSGSGKSAENYQVIGTATESNCEIKTSGRYTYEMGRALFESRDPKDKALWEDWYAFTKELALQGAFSDHPQQKKFAREFIERSFPSNARPDFSSPEALRTSLDVIASSPDHMLWFEYNFLYVLAGQGSIDNLGDHGPDGYAQRARFYAISEEGRLRFAKHIARYLVFIGKNIGIIDELTASKALSLLDTYTSLGAMCDDISS